MESDAVVSIEFRRTFPLNFIEIDVLIPHGMPWKFFSKEIDGIPWRYFLRYVPIYLKELCHAIFYLFEKLTRAFEAIEFQE